jgi:hypothetical protein
MSGRKVLLSSIISSVKFMKDDLNGIWPTARWGHGEADTKASPGRAARSLAGRPDQFSKEIGSRTSLLDVLALYPIFDTLCSHLDIGGLLTLKKLSKTLSEHLATHSKERWNASRRLQ